MATSFMANVRISSFGEQFIVPAARVRKVFCAVKMATCQLIVYARTSASSSFANVEE